MTPITANDPISKSADLIGANIAKLRELFPEAFSEDGLNFDVLKQLLGGAVTEGQEKYGLNWHGKRAARQHALTPSVGTLRPAPADSVDWDSTQNLMIEGDNLEVLKLLQKSYSGKVKLIYIDPPYNTGNDFVYHDDFRDPIANYKRTVGDTDYEGTPLTTNREAGGRFHTNWLNMMYPRLMSAKQLLSPEGAIFVSCDETEQARLRTMMDEVFGEENFVADLVWAAGRKNDSQLISVSHEYIVCYVRDIGLLKEQQIEWRQRKKGLGDIYTQAERLKKQHGTNFSAMTEGLKAWFRDLPDSEPAKAHRHYCHIDARGVYFPDNISWPGGGGPQYEVLHPRTRKPVAVPSRGWMTSDPNKMQQWIAEDRVHFGADETSVPCIKSYLSDREFQTPYSVFYQDGRAATKRLRELMGEDVFTFPKDETVLQEIVAMTTVGGDIVLDFFAGSGTTAHAVMAQNAADGGERRFILIQLPEQLDPNNKDQKAAAEFCTKLKTSETLAELTKERLRRAAKKVKNDAPLFAGDVGFRVYKLDTSNIRPWNPTPDDLPGAIEFHTDHILEGRTEDDILTELVLKLGLDLCVPIEKHTVTTKTVCSIGGVLFVCLAPRITAADAVPLAKGIADLHKASGGVGESMVVFRDSAFDGDDVAKTNLTENIRQLGLTNVRSL